MNFTQERNLAKAKELLAEVEKLCFNTNGESILQNIHDFEKEEKQRLIEIVAFNGLAENDGCQYNVSENDILKRVYIAEAWNKISQLHNTITEVNGLIEELEGMK